MISQRDIDAIDAHVATFDVGQWAPLTSSERDLLRRVLAPLPQTTDTAPAMPDAA